MRGRRIRSRNMFLLAVCILAVILGGCASGSQPEPSTEALGENQYRVYYLTGTDYDLTSLVYEAQETELSDLVMELMKELSRAPSLQVETALPQELSLISSYLEGDVLNLNFGVEYSSMAPVDEVLCRAAIVYTMLQIPDVGGVAFNVAGAPLASNSGSAIGTMTADSFEYSINQTLREVELTLYFTDESGAYLVPEKRNVVYRSGMTLERLVVEELIDGPAEEGHLPVLEQGLKLENISVKDNICYLYFDNSFLNNHLEVEDYIPIYAIVNSLSELTSISRVQFVFDRNQDLLFRDTISLSGNFSRNLDYIREK